MIQIDVFRIADGKISGYQVHGHSGTAPRGRDIVCAGISALAQTALLGIGEHLHRPVDFQIKPSGDLRMKLRGEPDDLTQAILETMRLGFVEIARANPNAVHLKDSQGVK
jgi:uncharacterized protein